MSKKVKDENLENQVKYLGFRSIAHYEDWCLKHGISTKLNKSDRELKEIRRIIASEKSDSYLKVKQGNNKRKLKDFLKDFDKIGTNAVLPSSYGVFADLKNIYHLSDDENFKKQIYNFAESLINADLDEKVSNQVNFADVLKTIVKYHKDWVRSPDSWKIKSHNTYRQYTSLLRNLFCLYKIPDFMDKVWYSNREEHINWYLHLGKGKNIRLIENLPIPFTKKMAHYFCEAPSDYEINEAIRYGQVLAMGGNPRLAGVLRATRLCRQFEIPENETFWESVIRWFSVQVMFDYTHVGPIIDYIHDQRFVPTTEVIDGVAHRRPPVQPNLTMNGRNAENLIGQVQEWHDRLNRERRQNARRGYGYRTPPADLKWAKSPIRDFEFAEGQNKTKKIWRIQELCSSVELQDEGRQLDHCVSSYAYSCHDGRNSIWSLNKQDQMGRSKELTIEVVNADKKIVQIRGKMNKMPNEQQMLIINRWAQTAGLSLGRNF